MRRPMACLAVLAVAGACAPAARAACSAYPALVYHGLDGTYFACDDRSPVSAFAYQISDPLFTNSGGAPILACEQYDPATCPSPGVVGDGAIRVLADWGQSGFNGCPVTATGPNRIAIVVQAADGQGLVATLSGADPSFGYLVEAAHPFDAATSQVFPLPCTRQGGAPQILADVPRPDGKVNLILHFTPPLVYSDCDPGTVGQAVGTCTDAFQPDVRLGRIFTSQQPCHGRANLSRSAWFDTGVLPDAYGNATVTVDLPTAGACGLVGYTALIGGFESGGMIGFATVPPTDCYDGDGDGWTICAGDCNDADPRVHPGAPEICNGIDDNCNDLTDEGPTGVSDTDGDGVNDACDNCPTVRNPTQDPAACEQRVVNIFLSLVRGVGTIAWETTHEVDLRGFNIFVFDGQGNGLQLNRALIGCFDCVTGQGNVYTFRLPTHKGSRSLFVATVRRSNGQVDLFGPAVKVQP